MIITIPRRCRFFLYALPRLTDGDLFTHIIAISSGFLAPASQRGRPNSFISHGTGDPTLPIERTSRRIVPQLEAASYDVDYVEFTGGHAVPPGIARQAVDWFLAPVLLP